jgi:hypothetical protein
MTWAAPPSGDGGGPHTHPISDVTNLQTTLDGKAAASVVTDHVALADPHTQYQNESEKAQANGYASLGADGKVPSAQLPASSGAGYHDTIMSPVGLNPANLTAVTAQATNTSYFLYCGRLNAAITTADVRFRVTTLAATITWAEIGIFTGTPVVGGNPSLTRRGFTNVAAVVNTTGLKTVTVALSGVSAGDDIWIAYGSQATTPFQARGTLADDLQSGVFCTFAGRISTMATPATATIAAATLVPAWARLKV